MARFSFHREVTRYGKRRQYRVKLKAEARRFQESALRPERAVKLSSPTELVSSEYDQNDRPLPP
jgi:hypothetical protein